MTSTTVIEGDQLLPVHQAPGTTVPGNGTVVVERWSFVFSDDVQSAKLGEPPGLDLGCGNPAQSTGGVAPNQAVDRSQAAGDPCGHEGQKEHGIHGQAQGLELCQAPLRALA